MMMSIAADCAVGEFEGRLRTYEREYSYAVDLNDLRQCQAKKAKVKSMDIELTVGQPM